jgi:hypothetical protein
VSIPLPAGEVVRKVIGDLYNPDKVLNVIKMFAGTGDMRALIADAFFFVGMIIFCPLLRRSL